MCGIVGYIGKNAINNAISGVEKLQYRGYDSAGVAYITNGQMHVKKAVGQIESIKGKVHGDSSIALSHVRWSTTGKPTEQNAHPHISGNIAVVHNGIINNYREIKDTILKERRFYSETDSEVIAHLIDIAPGDFYNRVREAVSYLQGSYAIAVMDVNNTDTIVVARKHSPLVVGIFDNGAIVASDIHAILSYTNQVTILHDNDLAVVKKNHLTIYNDGEVIKRDILNIPWKCENTDKGEFDTYMEKEIHEQPVAIYDTMMKNDWRKIGRDISNIMDKHHVKNITLTACGTSLHSCMYGSMLIEGLTNIPARPRLASELEASHAVLKSNMVVAVSQSGETYDTLSAVRYAKSKGAVVISIVNTMGSSMERESDYTIYMAAGPEISVASTKAFIVQMVVFNMLSIILYGWRFENRKTEKMFDDMQKSIYGLADAIKDVLELKPKIKILASHLSEFLSILYIGRGLCVPVALEGALKLKEISYIHAEGFAAGELKHGSIALIDDKMPVVALAFPGDTYDKIISNIEEAKTRGAVIITIGKENDEILQKVANIFIGIPEVAETLMPILGVVPLQLLAMYVAEALGRKVDFPKNLAKSVTVE